MLAADVITDMDAKQVHHSCPASPRPTLAPTSSATILATKPRSEGRRTSIAGRRAGIRNKRLESTSHLRI